MGGENPEMLLNSDCSSFARTLIMSAGLALLAQPGVAQTTHQVPADHATIQAAIVAAGDGDTIQVSPGTYGETLDLLGKSLLIEGVGGSSLTTVDATGLNDRVVTEVTAAGSSSILRGLTLTGGVAPLPLEIGGGVYVDGSFLSIEECVIQQCTANNFGGGVGTGSTAGTAVIVKDSLLSENLVVFGGGGGASGNVILMDSELRDNDGRWGGGIYFCLSAQGCLFEGNSASSDGGAAYGPMDILSDCTFVNNSAFLRGGALFHLVPVTAAMPAYPTISDLEFIGNKANRGGAIYAANSGAVNPNITVTCLVERCVFLDNKPSGANPLGDGVYLDLGLSSFLTSRVTIRQCTFRGDAIVTLAWNTDVNSSAFWFHADPVPTGAAVEYTAIQGSLPGTGNIGSFPQWVDPAADMHLLPGSPCIDAGDPSLPLDPDGSRADMGALPYSPWSDVGISLAGASGAPLASGNGPMSGGSSNSIDLIDAADGASTFLVVGFSDLSAPFKGGLLVPNPDLIIGLVTDGAGTASLPFAWPNGVSSGFQLWLQWWTADAGGPAGFSASQGLLATTP